MAPRCGCGFRRGRCRRKCARWTPRRSLRGRIGWSSRGRRRRLRLRIRGRWRRRRRRRSRLCARRCRRRGLLAVTSPDRLHAGVAGGAACASQGRAGTEPCGGNTGGAGAWCGAGDGAGWASFGAGVAWCGGWAARGAVGGGSFRAEWGYSGYLPGVWAGYGRPAGRLRAGFVEPPVIQTPQSLIVEGQGLCPWTPLGPWPQTPIYLFRVSHQH